MLNHPPEDYARTFDSEHQHSCPDSVSTCLLVIPPSVAMCINPHSLVSMHVDSVKNALIRYSIQVNTLVYTHMYVCMYVRTYVCMYVGAARAPCATDRERKQVEDVH